MKKTELEKIGFTESWLLMVFRTTKGIAWKTGQAPNCPIMFDTYELEKFRKRMSFGR
jgi:hypothetical protein